MSPSSRRRFMSDLWKSLNVATFSGVAGILGSLGITSLSSRHPAALACYECRACLRECPLRWDVVQFLIAARINNPWIYMSSNIDVKLWEWLTGDTLDREKLMQMDPNMIVEIDGNQYRISEAPGKPDKILKIRAKDAAQICTLCMLCTKNCPIAIEITEIIMDLKLGGNFGIPPEFQR